MKNSLITIFIGILLGIVGCFLFSIQIGLGMFIASLMGLFFYEKNIGLI